LLLFVPRSGTLSTGGGKKIVDGYAPSATEHCDRIL
jgi:hypothetical protein